MYEKKYASDIKYQNRMILSLIFPRIHCNYLDELEAKNRKS